MRSLWNPRDREDLLARLERLEPGAPARWGRFTAANMLAHLNDTLRMSSGILPTKLRRSPLRFPLVKQLVIYVAPWPKGVPTAPELLARTDRAAWEEERAAFPKVLEGFTSRPRGEPMPEHPAFGRLSRRTWGFLAYRHSDHHFRQFGV